VRKSVRLLHSILPKRITLEPEIIQLLAKVYPTLDFNRIYFFNGMPWFMKHAFAVGITLPGTYNLSGINIYLNGCNQRSTEGLGLIVHELFHGLQYKELHGGYGVGFMRSFLVFYLTEYFLLLRKNIGSQPLFVASKSAYDCHPMETPAYQHEFEFKTQYHALGLDGMLADFPATCIVEQSGYQFQHSRFTLLPGVLITLLFMLIKPIIELILLLFVPVLWVLELPFKLFQKQRKYE